MQKYHSVSFSVVGLNVLHPGCDLNQLVEDLRSVPHILCHGELVRLENRSYVALLFGALSVHGRLAHLLYLLRVNRLVAHDECLVCINELAEHWSGINFIFLISFVGRHFYLV